MIEISTMFEYKNKNCGVNALKVTIGELTIYFAERELVAIHHPRSGFVVSERCTGRLIHAINPSTRIKIPEEQFMRYVFQLAAIDCLAGHFMEGLQSIIKDEGTD